MTIKTYKILDTERRVEVELQAEHVKLLAWAGYLTRGTGDFKHLLYLHPKAVPWTEETGVKQADVDGFETVQDQNDRARALNPKKRTVQAEKALKDLAGHDKKKPFFAMDAQYSGTRTDPITGAVKDAYTFPDGSLLLVPVSTLIVSGR